MKGWRGARPGVRFAVLLVGVVPLWMGLGAFKTSTPEVILYGDSVSGANQSGPFFDTFVTAGSHATVRDDIFPGTAPCQWLPRMHTDATSGTVSVAVLEFTGDAFGCESYTAGSPSYYAAYRSQVTEAARWFSEAGVHTFLIGVPLNLIPVEEGDRNWDHLNEIYAQIAAVVPNTTFVNAGASVEEHGEFAWTLPCLPFEPYCGPGGQNPVRARDGSHFCPLDPNSINCGDYESGALRFGSAEARAVNGFLATGSAPAYEGPPLPRPGTRPRLAPGQHDPYVGAHDILKPGQSLGIGQALRSLDGSVSAVLQPDGNFVCAGPQGPVWSTGTEGSGATELVFQRDGNVVLDGPAGVVWSTGTSGSGGFFLALQNDARFVLYGPSDVIWSS